MNQGEKRFDPEDLGQKTEKKLPLLGDRVRHSVMTGFQGTLVSVYGEVDPVTKVKRKMAEVLMDDGKSFREFLDKLEKISKSPEEM